LSDKVPTIEQELKLLKAEADMNKRNDTINLAVPQQISF